MNQSDNCDVENSMKIIRQKLRGTVIENRKHNREVEITKLRRVALGDEFNYSNRGSEWNMDHFLEITKTLKRKALEPGDYRQLAAAFVQDEEYINKFMSVAQILAALVRDLSSANPETQILALHCCCNISLGNGKISTTLCKYVGPYLITQLETSNNPLLETCAWTIGNLCSGSNAARETLVALGCFDRLLSLLQYCQATILSSIVYAIRLYLYGDKNSRKISESDVIRVTKILVPRVLNDDRMSCDVIWLLALLSSTLACQSDLSLVSSPIFMHLINILEIDEGISLDQSKEITALVRFLGNLSAGTESVAEMILMESQTGCSFTGRNIFNKLLAYPYNHVRKETFWLIGNLYNHPSPRISIPMRNHLQLLDFNQIMAIEGKK